MRSDFKTRTTVNSTARAPSAEASEHVLNLANPCTTIESSCFKENSNINKSETPKLFVEPLQMKRKKKGGGHNLRKSLAWDKAFSTEEGVLDPFELSVISGASCRKGLPSINEDTPPIKHLDIQKLERDLLKEMHDEDLGTDESKDWLSPKINSLSSNIVTSTSLTSHRFPTHLGNKSGSRCGDCPRPLPSSPLKRPANVNVGKAAGKDLKLLKVPGLKPSLSPICATTRNTIPRVNSLKHSQITKPGSQSCIEAAYFNIQRNAGSKSFSKSLQNIQSASKSCSLRPPRNSDGNSILQGNSSFKRLPSINMNPVVVENADNLGSKIISDMTPAKPVNSSKAHQQSTSFAVPFSRNVHVGGTTMHPLQNHPVKPSGLRMPSPSLSFFSQPKRSLFHDLPLRDKETDVCGSQKPDNSRLQDNLGRAPKINNNIPASTVSSSKAISSSSECLASSQVSAVEVLKPNMVQKTIQKIPDISKNRTGRITHEEKESQKIEIELPSETGSCEQMVDDKCFRKAIEGYHEEACKPDYHQQHNAQTDTSKDSFSDTDRTEKDKNVMRTKERASEHVCVSQQSGSLYNGSACIDALELSRAKAENSYFGSMHLCADLLKEAARTEASTDILTGEVDMENVVFATCVGDCRHDISLNSQVDDDTNESGKGMEPLRNVAANTSESLLPEKQFCLQNSQQEENVEKQTFVVPNRKDGNKVMDTKAASSLSPGKMHDCNFDEDKMTGQLLVSTEFNFVDDSFASENHSTLIDVSLSRDFKGNVNVSPNGLANKYLTNNLHQDTPKMGIDYCSSFPESRTCQGSQENTLGNVTEMGLIIQDGSADNQLSSVALTDSEPGMGNLRDLPDEGNVLVQSPESNMLNECCVKELEWLTLPSAEFIAEVAYHNPRLDSKDFLQDDVSHVDNAPGSTEGSVTGQTELFLSTLRSTSFSAKETPLRDEKSDDAYGVRGYAADVMPVEPFSDTTKSDAFEDRHSSFIFPHPKSDHVKFEAALTPKDSLNEKSCLIVLPPKAIPFSDEWLAAIEAAGEDILTKKSGAVQNSPPDKSLPEPGPWSPVKRQNNQIGPFDCTKFTNIVHSDSN